MHRRARRWNLVKEWLAEVYPNAREAIENNAELELIHQLLVEDGAIPGKPAPRTGPRADLYGALKTRALVCMILRTARARSPEKKTEAVADCLLEAATDLDWDRMQVAKLLNHLGHSGPNVLAPVHLAMMLAGGEGSAEFTSPKQLGLRSAKPELLDWLTRAGVAAELLPSGWTCGVDDGLDRLRAHTEARGELWEWAKDLVINGLTTEPPAKPLDLQHALVAATQSLTPPRPLHTEGQITKDARTRLKVNADISELWWELHALGGTKPPGEESEQDRAEAGADLARVAGYRARRSKRPPAPTDSNKAHSSLTTALASWR